MHSLLALFLGLVMLTSSISSQECTHVTTDPTSGATIRYSQLHLIRPTVETQDFFIADSANPDYSYLFRICENTVNICGSSGHTAACQLGNGNHYSLGTLETQFILDFPSLDKSRGVMIEYSNGTICPSSGKSRRVLITIECDPNAIGPLSSLSAANHQSNDPCEYEIYAKSIYACPDVADNVCAGQQGCGNCNALVGCGWCSATQRCIRGDENGPLDGTLCLGSKSYTYGGGIECGICSDINSCSECSANPNCKWCEDSGCIPYFERECAESKCVCPPCSKGQYCPPEGGECVALPNSAGLFVGGMFLGFALVGIGFGGYVFYKKRSGEYSGLA